MFDGVGINQILQESAIAKKTLYHHFASKDELVEAVVRYRVFFINGLASEPTHCQRDGRAFVGLFRRSMIGLRVCSCVSFAAVFYQRQRRIY